jgi:beta-N-acetylhexosaminidase
VKLVMTAHLALPALDGRDDLPATLSPRILKDLLRKELGFQGVIVTDAMDMHAISQGEGLGAQAAAAAAAGADLLLLTHNPADHERVYDGLRQAMRGAGESGLTLDPGETAAAHARILSLKQWLASQLPQPDLEVVGCPAHQAVAEEIAARSITLVRDQLGWLPLRPADHRRLAVIIPQPRDLTPADTSSYVRPSLAQALRRWFGQVDEFIVPHAPQPDDIAGILEQVRSEPGFDAVIACTINAFAEPGQARLVQALLGTGLPVIAAALRMPYDLAAFPEAPAFLCTYSLLEPSMLALARVICGAAEPVGRLPVSIPDLYPSSPYEPLF